MSKPPLDLSTKKRSWPGWLECFLDVAKELPDGYGGQGFAEEVETKARAELEALHAKAADHCPCCDGDHL